MLSESYKCDGQIELLDYLGQLEEETKKCLDCIYYKDFKCVRQNCHKIYEGDGWVALWTDERNRNHGSWPTCMEWLEVETVMEDRGEFFTCDALAKDKTFKWSKDSIKSNHFYGTCIAWKYKGDKA